MTPFKGKLDKELGEAPLFTRELQAEILHKAQQPIKKQRHWQYPFVLVSTTAILLFFIIIGPWTTTNNSKQATIDEIASNEAVKQFATAPNWREDTFTAGRIGWVFGQLEFQQGTETELIGRILQQAELSEKNEDYNAFRDVWLQFENGQIAKLKMQHDDEQLAFIDVNTDLFYKIDAVDTTKFFSLTFEDDSLSSSLFFTFIMSFYLVGWIVEKVVRNIFNIHKEPKYVSRGHKRATIIFNIAYALILLVSLMGGWFIYYGVAFALIVSVFLSSIMIEYYYGREEKRHYVSIAMTVTGAISLLIFFFHFEM